MIISFLLSSTITYSLMDTILSKTTDFETFQEHHLHGVESIPPHQPLRAAHRTLAGGPVEVEVSLT